MGQETDCGSSSPAASPASFTFDVSSHIKSVTQKRSDYAYFLAEAKDMNDKHSWKQLGYKGGASLTVHYSYPPTLYPADNKQHVFPSTADQGRTVTTTPTPTLSWRARNKFPNGVVRNVTMTYQVMDKTGKVVASGYGPDAGKYTTNGSDWPVKPALPDGDYTWRAAAKNQDGLWAGVWTATQKFTVDTLAPKAPAVQSAQFPERQIGGGFNDKGTFVFRNDRTNNVTGYLFSFDGDLAGVAYKDTKGTAWTTGAVIDPGAIYFAKADNKDGTGAAVVNGSAGPVFAPRKPGPHKLAVKAVDQAGSTSPQTIYEFNAGQSTPLYVYGDKMITGWTEPNTDGTSTVVPAATTTSTTGRLITQPASAGSNYYADGFQGMFANVSTTSKIAVGDSATFWLSLPRSGLWEMGANLTTGADYGKYTLTLDQGKATQAALTSGSFDAYTARTLTRYTDLGPIKDAGDKPLFLAQGLHSITLKVTGTNTGSLGNQAGIDVLRLVPTLACAINDTKGCLNNTAISTFTSGATPPVTTADADGANWSINAADLAAAGWNAGGSVTLHGASIKLPATYGDGKSDNMLAAGQLINVPAEGVVNKGNAVVFAGFAVNGDIRNATGRITYAKDNRCNVSSQSYTMDWIVDWGRLPTDNSVLTLPGRNHPGGQVTAVAPGITAISVPLACPGTPVTSVSLPVVSGTVEGQANALHILGLGVRPTSSTGTDAVTRWVGSWAAAQDVSMVPYTWGTGSAAATVKAQTVRIPAQLSIGTGTESGRVRVRLANTLGRQRLTFDAASVAPQDPEAGGATAASEPVKLTFGGAGAVTLPAGGDVLSDPVDLSVADRSTLLVSLWLHGAYDALPGHLNARNPVYLSPYNEDVDRTGDAAGDGFQLSPMTGLPFLAGIDVSTPEDDPAGALVLYGDHTVNSDNADADGRSKLSDNLAAALSTDDLGTTHALRAGVLNLGSSSRGNRFLLPRVPNSRWPQNAAGLVDREILAQTNARIVVISAGSSDLLTCTAVAAECAAAVQDKLIALASQVQQYRADDALNYAVNVSTSSRTLKVYVATLPPFTGTHTAGQETARQSVNAAILGSSGTSNLQGYADGVIDFAAAVTTDGLATGATVRPELLAMADGKSVPNDLYYESLAWQYVLDADSGDGIVGDGETAVADDAIPAAEWKFSEGAGPLAGDTGSGTGSPENPQFHDAALTDVTWSLGRRAGSRAGTFNGTSSFANTGLPLNTAKSFTVGAWVRLSNKTADHTILTRDASGNAALSLRYEKATDKWLAQMASAASGDTVSWANARSDEPAAAGVWTHVAVVFDAVDNGLALYVNGYPQGRADNVTAFQEPNKPTWIGRSATAWFAGDVADVRVWARVVNDSELATEAMPKMPMVNWQFEDQSQPGVAKDSSPWEANGVITGGATWMAEGHPDPDGPSEGVEVDRGALTLNGTDSSVRTTARLRTDQSFTAAGWVRLTKNSYGTVVGQSGAHSSGFLLNYNVGCTCWRFLLPTTDGTSPTTVIAQDPTAAKLNTWTHLAAVYNATTATSKLYVNGAEVASTPATGRTWNATGDLIAGRAWWNDGFRDYLDGDLDDVQVFQEPLSARNITEIMREQPPTTGEPSQE